MKATPVHTRTTGKTKVALLAALGICLLQPAAYAADAGTGSTQPSATVRAMPDGKPLPTVAPAEPKITKEQAVDKVKSLFPKLKDVQARNVQLGDPNSNPPQYQNVWTIDWQFMVGTSSYGFNSKVDSLTGDLLQTNIYIPGDLNDESFYPPQVSKDEALVLAKAFIKQASPSVQTENLLPSEFMKFNNQALFGPVRYDFSFSLKVNGIPSPSESIHLTISGNGEVMNYNRSAMTASYPSAEPKISSVQADGKYAADTAYDLQYMSIYRYDSRKKDWFLGYAPRMFGGMADIDAQTGGFLDYQGNPADPKTAKYMDVVKKTPLYAPVSGTGEGGLLTAEEAAAAVDKTVGIPAGKTLSNRNLNTYFGDGTRQVWNLNWSDKTPPQPNMSQLNATVDAKTGQLLNYRTDSFGPPWAKPPKGEKEDAAANVKTISPEAAAEKASGWINLLYPNAADELKLVSGIPQPSGLGGKNYSFQFQRFYNGIAVSGETANVAVDGEGKLMSYYSNRTENLEEALKGFKAALTKDDAMKKHLSETQETLQYKNFGGFYTDSDFVQPSVKLIYSRTFKDSGKNGYVLDAADGKWRPVFINPSLAGDAAGAMPNDIAGHWAEADLKTMVQYGILKAEADGKLNPDSAITYGDWLRMFAKAVYPMYDGQYGSTNGDQKPSFQDVDAKSPYYSVAQLFVQSKWLDPKKTTKLQPEATLSREKLAESLIGIVKYGKLAGFLEARSLPDFKDADEIANKGAVSLAAKLGLMTGVDGAFKPNDGVTKAQAAAVLMKLVYLQGKLDQKIGMN